MHDSIFNNLNPYSLGKRKWKAYHRMFQQDELVSIILEAIHFFAISNFVLTLDTNQTGKRVNVYKVNLGITQIPQFAEATNVVGTVQT